MATEYLIYCDESEKRGATYSNFYGGLLVRSTDLHRCLAAITACKTDQHLFGEVKWQKITDNYLEKYKSLMDVFFSLVAEDKLKVRVMFTQNTNVPAGLTDEHRENEYLLLYYQFIKHAFGLRSSNTGNEPIRLRIYPDQLPETKEKIDRFRSYLVSLSRSKDFRDSKLVIRHEDIAEVESHDHGLLQCLDIVIGSINFRLNGLHKHIPPGRRRRGRWTVAKERLYKHISGWLRRLRPHFNIGISTGLDGDWANHWHHPYRHWLFVPKQTTRTVNERE
jgi:hypothetical protein